MCSEIHDIDTKADKTTSASREHNSYRADLESLIVYVKKVSSCDIILLMTCIIQIFFRIFVQICDALT